MKLLSQFVICFLILFTLGLNGCLELFPKEKVVFRGRIVEGYNTNSPIDSVLILGCLIDSVFVNFPDCDISSTYTNSDGNFYLEFEAFENQGRSIQYIKDGYRSLDSCKTMQDGSIECYMELYPTFFSIYSPFKNKIPFMYDSSVMRIQNSLRDTVVHYWTTFFINTSSDTSYYWKTVKSQDGSPFISYTYIEVTDDSNVKVQAKYFKNKISVMVDSATFFCPKGIGNKYEILDH